MNENRGGNPIVTILLVIIVVMAFDAFFNGGRIVNSLKPEPTYTTVTAPQPYYQPQQPLTVVTTAPPPAVQNLVTPLPGPTVDFQATSTAFAIQQNAASQQSPENIITLDDLAQPTRDYNLTDDQLAACIQAQMTNRRLGPQCPPNPAEYAGPGR